MMRYLPRRFRLYLWSRGYKKLFPQHFDERADTATWKTHEECFAEADLWERYGFPVAAKALRDAVARDQAWS